jgi:hypothetical protein
VKNIDAVATRVLWERDEADLVDFHLIDNPNTPFAVVHATRDMFAVKVLSRAD